MEKVLLAPYSNYKIGGKAEYFFEPKNEEALAAAVSQIHELKVDLFVLGGGTNVLFNDSGFNGAIVKIQNSKFKIQNYQLKIGAGFDMSKLLDIAIDKGLSGIEWSGGLPGTIGGAVRGNAGAFGGEIKDNIEYVISFDPKAGKFFTRNNKECLFDYRDSIFKNKAKNEIIWEIGLRLISGNKKEIQTAIEEKIIYRRKRHPMEYPNAGSIFKNIDAKYLPVALQKKFADKIKTDPFPVLPTAVLLADAGLKGISCGGAMISPKHPNFIVNVFNATSKDIKSLINLMKYTIKEKLGVQLEEEIIIL